MPETAMDWMDALDRSFSSAAQPLIAYNLERRRKSERDLLRQQQLDDEARQRGYQLQDWTKNRRAHLQDVAESERYSTEARLMEQRFRQEENLAQHQWAKEMQQAAQANAVALRQSEWNHADKVTKEAILRELRGKADKLGIPASPSADFETSFDYYNKKVNDAEAAGLIEFMKQGEVLQQELSNLTGSTAQERAALQMNILLGPNYADATKVLTAQERLALQKDPAAVLEIEHRLASDKSKKGKAAFEAFDQALNESDAQAEAMYLKRPSANRERAEIIKGRLQEHRQLLGAKFKDAVLGADTITSMFQGVSNFSRSRQQSAQGPAAPQERPAPAAILDVGPPAGSSPAVPLTPAQLQQFRTNAPSPEVRALTEPMDPVSQILSGKRFGLGAFGRQTTTPQLDNFLKNQANAQALIAPTAFPPVRIPQVGPTP